MILLSASHLWSFIVILLCATEEMGSKGGDSGGDSHGKNQGWEAMGAN